MRGAQQHGACNDDALLLAAAEHVGKPRQDVLDRDQSDLVHDFADPVLAGGFSHVAVDFQRFAEDAADIHEGRQRAEGVLLNVADL